MKKKTLVVIISFISIIILNIFIVVNSDTFLFKPDSPNGKIKTLSTSDNLQFYEWYKTWDDGERNYGYSICDDKNGSVYITGYSYNSDTKVFSPRVIQYDQSGSKIWELTWENHDYCRAITIDNESNLYIGGYRYNIITEDSDFMLMKLNKSKQLEWERIWGTVDSDRINGIAIDSLGNVITVGQSDNNLVVLRKYNTNGTFLKEISWTSYTSYISGKLAIDLADNIYVTGNSGAEMFLAKYNSTGAFNWHKTFGAVNQSIRSTDIVVDSHNNIYTCGYVDISLPSSAYVNDVFVAKFNGSGDQMWNKTWGGSSYDEAYGIAVDLNDNIYITGYTNSYEYQKLFVLKFSAEGMKMWSNVLDFSVLDAGKDIIVDSFGDIYVVGNTFSISGKQDILIVKISSIPPPQIPGYDIFPLLIVSSITLIIIGIRIIKSYKKKFLNFVIRKCPERINHLFSNIRERNSFFFFWG